MKASGKEADQVHKNKIIYSFTIFIKKRKKTFFLILKNIHKTKKKSNFLSKKF